MGERDKVVTSIWNVGEKDNWKMKVRACGRGFQEKLSHRRDLATELKKWEALSGDVNVTFRQGDPTDRDMYVISPKESVLARPKRQEAIPWRLSRPLAESGATK